MNGSIEEQTKRVLENVKAILKEKGLNLNSVIKSTIFITNLADFNTINSIYAEYFKDDYPARSCVEVSALPKGVSIEIECIACDL